jgi:hypothetical protein
VPDERKHLVVIRCADADPSGARSLEVKLACEDEPSEEYLVDRGNAGRRAFMSAFGVEPARVGVAVLPYVNSLDDADEDA